MQILLLLSALLSAMTGGFSSTGGEVVRVDQAEAQLLAPALAPQRTAAEAPRPASSSSPVRRSAEAFRPVQQVAIHVVPLASVRLIE